MPFYVIAPEDGECGDVLVGENLHLVVAHDHGDVGPMLIEIIGKLSDRILVAVVPLQHDFRRDLISQMGVLSQGHHLVERIGLALVEMPRLAIERDTILPVLRRNREHGAV
jgi:hypothetical protein